MHALLLANDLVTIASAQGAAVRAGVELRVAPPSAADTSVSEDTLLVALDLTAPLGDGSNELPRLVRTIFANAPDAVLVAFGPHVQEQRLEAARLAGCDRVVSRGQFHNGLEQMLRDRFAAQGKE